MIVERQMGWQTCAHAGVVTGFTSGEAIMKLDPSLEFRWQIPGSSDYQKTPFAAKPRPFPSAAAPPKPDA